LARPDRVWLHGEVLANDAGGPRLLVDVQPLTPAGRAATFDGQASLMILSPSASGAPLSLARWDFSPDDARTAASDSPGRDGLRFRLELPGDAPLEAPTEIWVRLVTEQGEKLLASAPIDLRQPGGFASQPFVAASENQPGAAREVATASFQEDAGHIALAEPEAASGGDGWTIARPGLSAAVGASVTQNQPPIWRASSEPLPMAIAEAPPTAPRVVVPAVRSDVSPPRAAPSPANGQRIVAAPVWSPTR
jgi:hypothetical protein